MIGTGIARLGVLFVVAAVDCSRAPSGAPDGPGPWLILNGCLVPGPFAVEIRDGEILVNGEKLVRPRPRGSAIEITPDPTRSHESVGAGGFDADDPAARLASLERQAKTYADWLEEPGALIVATDGNVNATWAPRGAAVLAEIRRLVRETSDVETRFERLDELLRHAPAARAIAAKFESE